MTRAGKVGGKNMDGNEISYTDSLSPDPETMSCRIHQEIENRQGNRLHRKECPLYRLPRRPTDYILKNKAMNLFSDDHRENVGSKEIKWRNSPISVPVCACDTRCVDCGLTIEPPTGNHNRLVLSVQWVHVTSRSTSSY